MYVHALCKISSGRAFVAFVKNHVETVGDSKKPDSKHINVAKKAADMGMALYKTFVKKTADQSVNLSGQIYDKLAQSHTTLAVLVKENKAQTRARQFTALAEGLFAMK